MTVYISLAPILWAALAALFVARYGHRVAEWIDRAMIVLETAHAIEHSDHTPAEPIPEDLLGYINGIRTGNAEMDGVLREQTLGVLYEQYGTLGSWDKVRAWSSVNLDLDTRADGWGNN